MTQDSFLAWQTSPRPLPLMTGEKGIRNLRYNALNSSYPGETAPARGTK